MGIRSGTLIGTRIAKNKQKVLAPVAAFMLAASDDNSDAPPLSTSLVIGRAAGTDRKKSV